MLTRPCTPSWPSGNYIAKRRADISGQDINCNAKDYQVTCLAVVADKVVADHLAVQ
jgi:hypothetical protein